MIFLKNRDCLNKQINVNSEAPPFYESRLEPQSESEIFSLQIGKIFHGVLKGSRVSYSYWIELHCSVALLL